MKYKIDPFVYLSIEKKFLASTFNFCEILAGIQIALSRFSQKHFPTFKHKQQSHGQTVEFPMANDMFYRADNFFTTEKIVRGSYKESTYCSR